MPIEAPVTTILPRDQKSPGNLSTLIGRLPGPQQEAFRQVQQSLDLITKALRTPQNVREFAVTDENGRMIFWTGARVVDNVLYRGFWSEEGYLGGTSPLDAPLSVIDGRLTISLGGSNDFGGLTILDDADDPVVILGKIATGPDEYGIYAKVAKIGGPNVANPVINADEDGVQIKGADIEITGTDGDGNNFVLRLSPSEVSVENTSEDSELTLSGGYLTIERTILGVPRSVLFNTVELSMQTVSAAWGTSYVTSGDNGYFTVFVNGAGAAVITLNGITGAADFAGAVSINSLSLTTALSTAYGGTGATNASGARTNLSVYSKSESDARYVLA